MSTISKTNAILKEMKEKVFEKNPNDPVAFMQKFLSDYAKSHTKTLMAMDIGGSLCKVCFYDPSSKDQFIIEKLRDQKIVSEHFDQTNFCSEEDSKLKFRIKSGGTLQFLKFPTHHLKSFIAALKRIDILKPGDVVNTTGGGAFKYSTFLSENLKIKTEKGDELECLLKGLNLTLKHLPKECYTITNPKDINKGVPEVVDIHGREDLYPYLLVNVGSGISILRVDSKDKFERVSGSFIGGGTYYGLCRLLTKIVDFKELSKLAEKGDSGKVNMTVADIYGGDYKQMGLSGEIIASSFGKLSEKADPWEGLKNGDIARALGIMVCVNIGQIANFCAEKSKVSRILFTGNFLQKNPLSLNAVTRAVDFYSKGKAAALFMEHEGYFGAIGALSCFFDD